MNRTKKISNKLMKIIVVALSIILIFAAVANADSKDKDTEILIKFGNAMAAVAEKVKPAVVNISTTKTIKTQKHPFFDDPLFRRFFGDGQLMPQKRKVTNLGSGVIATADGYILTNNHVIEGADDILVKLADNREIKGTVVGVDPKTDIAVIKINEKNLPTIKWADSDKLRVGEVVLAIGNPYGLNQTITMGIISALGRSGFGITDYEDFIQTDAAINPGNSGGALVNIKGELIGINTAIFSTSGGYQGIGFAIPSNMAKNVMDSIISDGKVVRGWLGVQIQPITPELAKQFNLKDKKGVLISDVTENSPAEKGDLRRGDVIIEYNGKKVENPFQLKNMVATTKPGKTIEIKIIRAGEIFIKKVTISELPTELHAAFQQYENVLKGVSVQDLTEELMRKLGVSKKIKGVVITNVEDDSPASGILTRGDIIVEINMVTIANSKEFSQVVSKIPKGHDVLLLIVRNGVTQYVTISSQ